MIQPKELNARPRIRNPRSAKGATQTRMVRSNRARYIGLVRVGAVVSVVLVTLLAYVWLTSNVTSMTYAVASAHERREALLESTSRLDDQLVAMRSDERLARLAAKLGMHEPQRLSVIQMPAPKTVARESTFPVLSSIAGWFGNGAPAQREH